MTTTRSRAASIALAAILVAGVPALLSGCSIAEGIIEQQTGGDVDLPGQSVPADFPSVVPLAEGEVTLGAGLGSGDSKAWNVTITTAGSDNPGAGIAAALEGAGFTSDVGVAGLTDDGGILTYGDADYGVVVLIGKDGDSWTANYTVTAQAG